MSKQTKGKVDSSRRPMSHDLGHASDRGDAVSVSSTGPLAGVCRFLPPYDARLDSKRLIPEDQDNRTVIPLPEDTGQTIEEALEALEALPGWRSDE